VAFFWLAGDRFAKYVRVLVAASLCASWSRVSVSVVFRVSCLVFMMIFGFCSGSVLFSSASVSSSRCVNWSVSLV